MYETVTVDIAHIQRMVARMHPNWTVRKVAEVAREQFEALKTDIRR